MGAMSSIQFYLLRPNPLPFYHQVLSCSPFNPKKKITVVVYTYTSDRPKFNKAPSELITEEMHNYLERATAPPNGRRVASPTSLHPLNSVDEDTEATEKVVAFIHDLDMRGLDVFPKGNYYKAEPNEEIDSVYVVEFVD